MGDVSHALTKASAKGATEDGTGRGTPIVGTHGRVDEGPTGTLTRMYSEQSGQDFGGGAGVIATGSTTPPPPSEHGEKNPRLGR
jgi:hypothetical protein